MIMPRKKTNETTKTVEVKTTKKKSAAEKQLDLFTDLDYLDKLSQLDPDEVDGKDDDFIDDEFNELIEIRENEETENVMENGVENIEDVVDKRDFNGVNEYGVPVFENAPEEERRKKYKISGISGLEIDLLFDTGVPRRVVEEVKTAVVTPGELRSIVDRYYQVQDNRMRTASRIRAIKGGTDTASNADPLNPLTCDILAWDLMSERKKETGYKAMIDKMTDNHPITRWLKENAGIGPIFAAALFAYLDITKAKYASSFLQYAGLNDNNRPWISSAKAAQIVQEVLGNRTEITDDDLFQLAAITKWPYDYLARGAAGAKRGEDYSGMKRSKTDLIKCISIPPYNVKLKKLCYLIGDSFIKNQNRGSKYGKIFAERKVYELQKNEAGEYAEEAKKALSSKNWDRKKDAYKAYSQGKLPLGHINARARRYAVKIFLCHVFEEMYRETFHAYPPAYYVFENTIDSRKHNKYIEPEVPFTWGETIPPQFDGAGNYMHYNNEGPSQK